MKDTKQYVKTEFETDKDHHVTITFIGSSNATAINGDISGELLNELDDVLSKIWDYNKKNGAVSESN